MRPPILWLAGGFAAGLWLGLTEPAKSWIIALPLVLGAAALAARAPLAAALGVAAVAGLLWGAAARRDREATCAGYWGRGTGEGGRVATVAATVRLLDPVGEAGGVVEAQVMPGPCNGVLRLRWLEGVPARGGTAWVVAGKWLGSADRGVLVVRRARSLTARAVGRGAVRDRIAARSAALFGSRAPLVDALVIGRRTELDRAVQERYVRSGLAHLLSISGLHVGFLAAWLGVLLARLPLGRVARFAASAALVGGYVGLLGFPAPATRSALMLGLDGLARLRQRRVAPRGVIAVAALVVLAGDPWALRSVGAWLSVVAVAAVIWAARATAGSRPAVRVLAGGAAATLTTAPITAYAFGTVAPIGVVANLVAIPLAGLAVPGLMLALLASWVCPPAAPPLAAGAGLLLALVDVVAAFAARVPGGHVVMPAGWPAAVLWSGVAALAWWLWHAPRRPWVRAARLALAAGLGPWALLLLDPPRGRDGVLTVHFLDVGQGDAAVLRTPAGRWIVIDGGPRLPGSDAGRRVVVPFLRRRGAERVTVLVASHADADHLGGVPALIDALPTDVVLEPGEPVGRPLYLEFLAAVQGSGARWLPARAGDRLELDGVVLDVLSPDTAWIARPAETNEHSVVLRVGFGRTRLLFPGDAGFPVEQRLLDRIGPVALLKVGHHGSRTATSEAWLDRLRPACAVISVGARNRYGHPTPEVLARLLRRGIAVHRTDRAGTITFAIDSQHADADFCRHH